MDENSRTSKDLSEDEKLSDAIMWSLSQSRIAYSRLQSYLQIGNNRANKLLGRMEELGFIRKLHGNLGWQVLPKGFEDIIGEAIDFLIRCGKTSDSIKEVLNQRADTTDAQINTEQD